MRYPLVCRLLLNKSLVYFGVRRFTAQKPTIVSPLETSQKLDLLENYIAPDRNVRGSNP